MRRAIAIGMWVAAIPVVLAAVAGVGGVAVFCGRQPILEIAFFSYGQCDATDTPYEVFTAFAFLGGYIGAFISVAVGLFLIVSNATSGKQE